MVEISRNKIIVETKHMPNWRKVSIRIQNANIPNNIEIHSEKGPINIGLEGSSKRKWQRWFNKRVLENVHKVSLKYEIHCTHDCHSLKCIKPTVSHKSSLHLLWILYVFSHQRWPQLHPLVLVHT